MYLICCGMPRSASTLQYQLFDKVVQLSGIGVHVGWSWDRVSPRKSSAGHPLYVVKVHEPNPDLEKQLDPDHLLYAYTYRDIRDAAVSMIQWKGDHFNTVEWVRKWIEWSIMCFRHFTSKRHVFVSRYEDWTRDIPNEIRRVEEFLGVNISQDKKDELARHLSLKGQTEYIRKELLEKKRNVCSEMLLNIFQIKDAKIGKWRTFLSHEQIRVFDELASDWLIEQGYKPASGITTKEM